MRLLFSSLVLLFLLFAAPARAGEIKLATWNLNWLTTRAPGDPLLPPELPGRGAEGFARLRPSHLLQRPHSRRQPRAGDLSARSRRKPT